MTVEIRAAAEKAFRDGLVDLLELCGYTVSTEVTCWTGRADLVVWRGPRAWLIVETKVADALVGVGQVLGYVAGTHAIPVLATPRRLRTPRVVGACAAAGVSLVHDATEIDALMWGHA